MRRNTIYRSSVYLLNRYTKLSDSLADSFIHLSNSLPNLQLVKQHIKDPLYRNSLFLMANATLTVILGFLFWIVIARYYNLADVGWGSAVITAISLIALFSRLGLDVALIRFLPKAEKPVEMINSCFTISALVSLVLSVLFVAVADIISPESPKAGQSGGGIGFINNNAWFALAFIAFTVLWTFSGMLDQVFIARRRADFVLYKNTIYSVLKLVLPFIMVYFFYAFGIVSSWGVSVGIGFFIALFLFLPRTLKSYRIKVKIDIDIIKSVWKYSFRNYFVTLLSVAPNFILPLIVINRLGPEQNAYFYIAWLIATAPYIIPNAIAQSLFAEGSHFGENLEKDVRRSYKFTFVLLIPVIVLLLACGKWTLMAFGETYAENALMLLYILALASVFIGINSVYSTILLVKHRIGELILLVGFIDISLFVGSFIIIPVTGIVGVGYVFIAAQGIVSVYILLAMRRFKLYQVGR